MAWAPFINPIRISVTTRLLMYFPLAICVALVYRGTRSRSVSELPWPTVRVFFSIVIGMTLIAIAAYVIHELVLHYGS
jgi:hypothetical protein